MISKKKEMFLNLNIPGQLTEAEVRAICCLASRVPANGIVVEVGSLCGLSSWHWSKNVPTTAQVFCIDPWKREPWMIDLVENPLGIGRFGKHIFDCMTQDCDNIIAIQGYSPEILINWKLPINIYFDDAMHVDPYLKQNLDFWSKFIVPGGYISGHDFCDAWPDVMINAYKISDAWGSKIERCDTMWWIQRPL